MLRSPASMAVELERAMATQCLAQPDPDRCPTRPDDLAGRNAGLIACQLVLRESRLRRGGRTASLVFSGAKGLTGTGGDTPDIVNRKSSEP